MRNKLLAIILCAVCISGQVVAQQHNQLRLATTTSVESSGLLNHLVNQFQSLYPYTVSLSVVGSGKALRLGINGDVDLVWVHSPAAEHEFINAGYGLERHTIVRNDFVLVGPRRDPAGVKTATDIREALRKITATGSLFVSRADDSGTNQKELELWQMVGVDPVGLDWYLETGASMADSLRIAEDDGAYLIVDRATFLVRKRDHLVMLFEDVVSLSNPYSLIAVNPETNPQVNAQAANHFIQWLTSAAGQQAISAHQHEGQPLYVLVK